jgi:hypothetical protein
MRVHRGWLAAALLAPLVLGGCASRPSAAPTENETFPAPASTSTSQTSAPPPASTDTGSKVGPLVASFTTKDSEDNRALVQIYQGAPMIDSDAGELASACDGVVSDAGSTPDGSVAVPFAVVVTLRSSQTVPVTLFLPGFGGREGWALDLSDGAKCDNSEGLVTMKNVDQGEAQELDWTMVVPGAITPKHSTPELATSGFSYGIPGVEFNGGDLGHQSKVVGTHVASRCVTPMMLVNVRDIKDANKSCE